MKKILNGMEFDVLFDGNIDKDNPGHFVSPGGYVLNGKWFDFFDYEGRIDKKEKNRVHILVNNIINRDEEIIDKDCNGLFSDFVVHVGSDLCAPDRLPVLIEKLTFLFKDGDWWPASKKTESSATGSIDMLW